MNTVKKILNKKLFLPMGQLSFSKILEKFCLGVQKVFFAIFVENLKFSLASVLISIRLLGIGLWKTQKKLKHYQNGI
jgi:hypothetical protein